MKAVNEPADQPAETRAKEPAHQIDERDAVIRDLNEALVRWLAEFDAMENAA